MPTPTPTPTPTGMPGATPTPTPAGTIMPTLTPMPVASTTPRTGSPLLFGLLGTGALSALGWKMRRSAKIFWK
jgi:hypothetical protein